MDELQKLYDVLVREGKYTKSFDEFKAKWGSDEVYRDKVYDVVSRDKLYTKDKNSFFQKYSGAQQTEIPKEDSIKPVTFKQFDAASKKKVSTASSSEDGSLVLPTKDDKRPVLQMPKEKKPEFPLYSYVKDIKKYEDIYDKQLNITPPKGENAYLNERLDSVNKNLINSTEEYVVPEMQYQFGELGFIFEKTGITGDYMKVTAPNGKVQEISLDNFLDSSSQKEAEKLQKFIKENTAEKRLFALEKTMTESDRKFNSQKQVDDATKIINKDLTSLNEKQKNFIVKKNEYEKQIKSLEEAQSLGSVSPQELNERFTLLEQQRQSLNKEVQDLLYEEEVVKNKTKTLDAAVGKYTIAKSKQGVWGGGLFNSFLGGEGSIASDFASKTIDFITEMLPTTGLMDPKELKAITIERAEKIGVAPPRDNQSIEDWKKTLTPNQLDKWEDEIDDYSRKQVKKAVLPSVRVGLKETIGDPNTTAQWENLKKEGFWGGAFLGLAASLPAMIGGSGPAGWAQRTALMYSQISDGLMQEMENDPNFADVSENEKLALTLPIGIASAVLEAYGLRNVMASKGLINGIVKSALGKAGKGVTAKSFRELVENEVEGRLAKGLLTVGAAGLAEAETGAAQELSETTFKEVYNTIKGKEMFESPESVFDLLENVVVAGAQEAVGGFVLGVPSAVSTAYGKKGFLKMSDQEFNVFEMIASDERMQSAYVTSLKDKVSQGLLTVEDAKNKLNEYRNSIGLYRQIPDGLNTLQKKEAMNLLKEKRDLEQYTQGKDPAMVTKQRNRINEINETLTGISEQDAIQEQAAGEVPVQSETIVGETVEGGETQAGSQVITEEGIQEEIVGEGVKLVIDKETTEVRGKDHTRYSIFDSNNNEVGSVSFNYREDLGGYQIENIKVSDAGTGIGTNAYRLLISQLDKPLISDSLKSKSADAVWSKLEKEGLAKFDEEQGKYFSIKPQVIAQESQQVEALADVESTAKALEGKNTGLIEASILPAIAGGSIIGKNAPQTISELYHQAKADGSNPQLVEAVENLLAPKTEQAAEGEIVAPKLVRDISILITPATVRDFNPLTKRIKALSIKYDKLVKEYSKNKNEKTLAKIKDAESQILNDAKQEIIDAAAKVPGVSVKFSNDKRGLWDGYFEPSFNMILSISAQADTDKVSDLLFDFAEKYSQDAFILETDSEYETDVVNGKRGIPLTEFDENGLMHYPQIIYTFDKQLTDEQLAKLSVELQNSGVDAFNINQNELKVSIIKFFPEDTELNEQQQYEERKRDFESKENASEQSAINVLGSSITYKPTIRIKKSSYQGAKNEGTTEQTREYDRGDVFEPFKKSTTEIEKLAVELASLRQKEIELQKQGNQLSPEDKARFDELNSKVQPVVEQTFEANKKFYEDAKTEVEGIANEAIVGMKASISPFPIKRPSRASVKTIRWYNAFTEKLGDGARVNIVVENDADADKVFQTINEKYPQSEDLRRVSEITELGYPKRLIEVTASNGVIAEIQVITNEAYLAKDGLSGFTGDAAQKKAAKNKLQEVRSRLGWNIPDGLGHYFYEIQRDINVNDDLRDEAARLSNLYYDAFTNPDSKLKESFMSEVLAFKNDVDVADKSNWDKGNEGKAPVSLESYKPKRTAKADASSKEEATKDTIEGLLNLDTKDKTNLEKVASFLDKADEDISKRLKTGAFSGGLAISLLTAKAVIKTLKALVKTGITLQEAIKRAAAENNVTEKDVIDTINYVAQQRDIDAKPQEVSEVQLPGYNRMMTEIDGIIEKSKRRGVSDNDTMQNVIDYMQKSKVYENASDTQREKMVRDIRKMFGKSERTAPKPAKLFGEVKDTNMITMSEYDLLKKQLKDQAVAAKSTKALWVKTSTSLTKYLKDMVKNGHVTIRQAVSILRKFSNTNMFDERSIDRFVDYMEKIFKNADYADKIAKVNKMLKTARKNIQTKLGTAQTLYPLLNRMLAINPTLIPDAVFDDYVNIVTMMGERKAVLDLQESGQLTDMVETILDAVDADVSRVEELTELFDLYQDKITDSNGKVDFAATVALMVKDQVISEKDAELMRKYKKDVFPMEQREQMTEEEIEEEKQLLISAIQDATVDTDGLPMKDERDLARELEKLLQTNAINDLDNTQLKNILRVIENINNGYMPHFAELVVERLNAKNNARGLNNAMAKAKPLPLSSVYSNLKRLLTGKDRYAELIRRNPLFYIDQVFGNFNTKAIYNAIFEKAAEAQAMFKRSINELNNKLDAAEDAVAKSFKFNGNKITMSKFKMMTYMLQLEYESNPDTNKVNAAQKYLKKTIDHINNGKSRFGERDAKMLQTILKDYTDPNTGEIDNEKLYNSFNEAEKNAIKVIQNINQSMRDKAIYTAAVIRGDKIHPLNDYIHHNVLYEYKPDESLEGAAFIDSYKASLNPSTKAKSLIERSGGITPLNFDVFASAHRGAKFVLMDYYLTQPIRTARKTINETRDLMKERGASRKETDIFNAVDRAFEEALTNLLVNNFTASSFGDKVSDFMAKQGYRAVLASLPRFAAELSSNVAFAMIADPKAFAAGVSYKGVVFSADASTIMNNLASKQTNRIFPNDTLSGRLIDSTILGQASGIKGGTANNDVANKIQQIYNLSLKKYLNAVELMADSLISTPDKMVMRPMWFGAFANEFKRLTGKEIDFSKVAANNEMYMAQNKEALDAARDIADQKTVLTGATDNAFMGVLKGTPKPDQKPLLKAFNMFNGFMTNFLIYEYMTARTGVMAATGNGILSKRQGAALLAAVATRMTLYTLMSKMLGDAFVGLFVDDDEEEDEKSLLQKIGQAMTSSATSIILGRDFGNATKGIVNQGIEYVNEEYLDFLREGDYDPYKDAIQYTVVPPAKEGKRSTLSDMLVNMMGPFGPTFKTADLAYRKATEPAKKEADAIQRSEDEIGLRLPLEVLGNLGMIPLYKDVRKVVNKQIYKDLEKAEKKTTPTKMSKEDMKKFFPDLYDRLYGPGGSLYRAEEIKKEIRAKKKKMDDEMKDRIYK